ncbi:hypothetical protein GMSM_20710 [Geomonas sp. Red276]
MIIRLVKKLIPERVKRIYHLRKVLGSTSSAIRYSAAPGGKVVDVTVGGENLRIRAGSSDLEVAISSLHLEEYGDISWPHASVIVDAGANIGTSAIYFARRFPEATVYAIEPEEDNFRLLVENTASYGNIVPIRAALWGTRCSRKIKNRQTGPWGYTVADTDGAAEATGQEIDCITMATLLADFGLERIDILKIDIEGGEKEVFEASASWIDKVDVVAAELHDRITMGCDRAFYLATKDFLRFDKHGEKVTAYRC